MQHQTQSQRQKPTQKAPTKPRTRRKTLYTLPLHMKHALTNVHLSKDLKSKLGTKARSIPVTEGDRVKVMRGMHKGKSGKVTEVDLKAVRVYLEGIMVRKAKGGEIPMPLHPSNLLLIEANMGDKGRKKLLDRKRKL